MRNVRNDVGVERSWKEDVEVASKLEGQRGRMSAALGPRGYQALKRADLSFNFEPTAARYFLESLVTFGHLVLFHFACGVWPRSFAMHVVRRHHPFLIEAIRRLTTASRKKKHTAAYCPRHALANLLLYNKKIWKSGSRRSRSRCALFSFFGLSPRHITRFAAGIPEFRIPLPRSQSDACPNMSKRARRSACCHKFTFCWLATA